MSTLRIDPKRDHVPAKEWAEANTPYVCDYCEAAIIPTEPDNRKEVWCHEHWKEICKDGDDRPSPCFFVEFGLLYDDHTWDTEVHELPTVFTHDRCEDSDLIDWANAVLAPQAAYRKVVQFTVYHIGTPGE